MEIEELRVLSELRQAPHALKSVQLQTHDFDRR
jgi:hypothetical protein